VAPFLHPLRGNWCGHLGTPLWCSAARHGILKTIPLDPEEVEAGRFEISNQTYAQLELVYQSSKSWSAPANISWSAILQGPWKKLASDASIRGWHRLRVDRSSVTRSEQQIAF
jgi:hypothetical protein